MIAEHLFARPCRRTAWGALAFLFGLAYLNKGDYPKALDALRKFVALEPDSPAAAEARNVIAAVEKLK